MYIFCTSKQIRTLSEDVMFYLKQNKNKQKNNKKMCLKLHIKIQMPTIICCFFCVDSLSLLHLICRNLVRSTELKDNLYNVHKKKHKILNDTEIFMHAQNYVGIKNDPYFLCIAVLSFLFLYYLLASSL